MSARIGIDLGGTKIAGVVLAADGHALAEARMAAPQGDYRATIAAIVGLVAELAAATGLDARHPVGLGMPGSIAPTTGRAQNSNSTWLNDRPFGTDLEAALGRPLRLANDANCFALSEATDGAGREAGTGTASVFGVILGTGCGGGLVVGGRLIDGPRGIGGEWGHNPLPWATADEHPGPRCWCGRRGCMETWVSGTALAADHARAAGRNTGDRLGDFPRDRPDAAAIAALAGAGDAAARATLDRHASRLARGLAHVVNLFDPSVIVLGGGLSRLGHLYDALPALMAPHIFAADPRVTVLPPRWGDASGVRGAARLWPLT